MYYMVKINDFPTELVKINDFPTEHGNCRPPGLKRQWKPLNNANLLDSYMTTFEPSATESYRIIQNHMHTLTYIRHIYIMHLFTTIARLLKV